MALTRLRGAGIAANAVTAAAIAPGAVDITDIADGAITTAKIANNAIETGKIANASIVLSGTKVTGTLPVANGGTGSTATPTAGGIVHGTGTAQAVSAAGTSGQPIVSGGASAPAFRPYTLPAADGSASQVLQTNGSGALSFATVDTGVGDHEFTLTTGNGFGSTNTNIRLFTTIARNVGTAITGANSATLGASATINEAGIYSVFYSDLDSGVGQHYGISLNSASLSTSIQSITTYPQRLASNQVVVASRQLCLSVTRRFAIGDVIRPHCTNTMSGNDTTNIFSVVKVST